ncbi:glycosyltransferase [Rossellomorea aquimaris]|uniref:Glycosyltransferase n=2 Tax=Bacillaceae TaxID=186817 RepID=A0A5D4TIF8_9BACI|nr:glycosyltransferase [Rossellomorea aquimaris]
MPFEFRFRIFEAMLYAKEIDTMNKRNVLIYRDLLLPSSETFVKTQAEGLKDFTPVFAGSYKIDNGLDLTPAEELFIMPKNSILNNRITGTSLKKVLLKRILLPKIKKIKPVLMHAHFGPDGTLALPMAEALKIPYVVTFHGYDVTTKDEHLRKSSSYNIQNYTKEIHTLQNSNALFIAASEFIKKKLIQKGFPEKQILVHYIGVNLDLLKRDDTVSREDTILFAGRLVKNKGCEYLIKAMKMVNEQKPHAKLIIAGDGPERHALEELASQLNVNIEFLGKIPYREVLHHMNKAKIFSVPSIEIETGASEGFGMVFAEAQAMGLPVASFETGGIPEAVSHNETGLLCPPKDYEKLAENILFLLENQQMWEEFSKAGVVRVKDRFSLHEQNKKLEEIYESMILQYKAR